MRQKPKKEPRSHYIKEAQETEKPESQEEKEEFSSFAYPVVTGLKEGVSCLIQSAGKRLLLFYIICGLVILSGIGAVAAGFFARGRITGEGETLLSQNRRLEQEIRSQNLAYFNEILQKEYKDAPAGLKAAAQRFFSYSVRVNNTPTSGVTMFSASRNIVVTVEETVSDEGQKLLPQEVIDDASNFRGGGDTDISQMNKAMTVDATREMPKITKVKKSDGYVYTITYEAASAGDVVTIGFETWLATKLGLEEPYIEIIFNASEEAEE